MVSTVKNCVALVSIIYGPCTTNSAVGMATAGTVTNNFGRKDMIFLVDDVSYTFSTGITSANWINSTWWKTTVGFSDSVWDFTDISATKGPTLKNMPSGEQTAVIK